MEKSGFIRRFGGDVLKPMDTREIIESIEYQSGMIRVHSGTGPSAAGDLDYPQFEDEVPCRIMRMSVGRLLVRVEEDFPVEPRAQVEIAVPVPQGLVHVTGMVERVNPNRDPGSLVSLIIADLDVQQRRKDTRYACQFPCRYTVMEPGETLADIRNRPLSIGKVVDISLNGLQFRDEAELPEKARLYLELILPDVRVSVFGNIIHTFHAPPKSYAYGVKFTQIDDLAISQLNRIVLQLRRRERAESRRPVQDTLHVARRRRI